MEEGLSPDFGDVGRGVAANSTVSVDVHGGCRGGRAVHHNAILVKQEDGPCGDDVAAVVGNLGEGELGSQLLLDFRAASGALCREMRHGWAERCEEKSQAGPDYKSHEELLIWPQGMEMR